MYVNQDLRISRLFTLHEKIKIQPIFEYFDLFNNANPAAIQIQQKPQNGTTPFGGVSQTLPGRQGEVALRIEF
jgi:hypothetical protein